MENFIVSARKYRPATFISVVGQGHITSTLKNAISRGQLAHAYLFCGPRGVGKTTCARIFAKAINCMNPSAEAETCGKCESCRSFDEGRSFNIHELDAASNNSVDDIRTLADQVRIPPQIGKYSVYIIDEVHMLSSQAFNAFLKTLEEPPAHAVFILATTEKHKIIPTILSRCQIFDFNRIKVEDGVQYMKHIAHEEGITYDEESLNLIARKADGGMRDALSMFDKAVSFCGSELKYKEVAKSLNILDYDTYFDAVDIILSGEYASALLMFDGVLSQGFSGQIFMSGLNNHLRDLLVGKSDTTASLLDVTASLLERYRQQASKCSHELLFDSIALLTELDSRVRTATNQRLLVELGLMKLCSLAKKKTLTATSVEDSSTPETHGSLAPNIDLPTLNAKQETATLNAKQETATLNAKQETATLNTKQETATLNTDQKPEVPATASATSVTAQATPATPDIPDTPATSITAPATSAATSAAPANPATTSFPGFGRSLTEIINGAGEEEEAEDKVDEIVLTDPDAQQKIERFCEKFVTKLSAERPRLGVVYETMEVEGNMVKVKVASQALHDEVARHRTETLSLLAAVAGVCGPIELEVTIDESMKAAKPIKLEDKIQYMNDRNPLFKELRRTLDLEEE